MTTNAFMILLFAVVIIFVFCALFAFFSGPAGLNYLVSELLTATIIFFLLFGAKMSFLKILIVILVIAVFSVTGYKIIVRAKKG